MPLPLPGSSQSLAKPAINYDIEALRGFAAVFVIWCHSRDGTYMISPGYLPGSIFNWGPSGHFQVLMFFSMSGLVIGLSQKAPLTLATTGLYLKKRAVRLVPIFWICIALALLAWPTSFSTGTIIANMFFLQGVLAPQVVLTGWSLHFECLYYLLFIPVSMFRLNPYLLAALAFVIAVLSYALYPVLHAPVLTSYGFGLVYWILGYAMSRSLADRPQAKLSYQVLLGCLLLVLTVDQFNFFEHTLQKIFIGGAGITFTFPGDHSPIVVALNLFDLSYLPFALLIILAFMGKALPHRLLALRLLTGLSVLNLAYQVQHSLTGRIQFVQPMAYLLAALVCFSFTMNWLDELGRRVVAVGRKLGELSYGLYMVHFPLMLAFNRVLVFSGTRASYFVRLALFLALSLVLGYILEKVIQPRIKSFFFKEPSQPLLRHA